MIKVESPRQLPTRVSPPAFKAAIVINEEFEHLLKDVGIINTGNRKSTDALARIIQLVINQFVTEAQNGEA